jgi:L-malate glycosyltransferase
MKISKNILLISTIYPIPEGNKGTYVCHYFAREWIKMGYNVRVIHFQAIYPIYFYWVARLFRALIASRTGAIVYTKKEKEVSQYEMENVLIYKLPIYKKKPHGSFSEKEITKQLTIINEKVTNDFVPDIIVGHFPNPQLRIVNELKKLFPNARTAMVLHGEIPQIRKIYGDNTDKFIKAVEVWGFRSKTIQQNFEDMYGNVNNSFICYSGIPQNYPVETNNRTFLRVHNFMYVGELIKLKYPEKILSALISVYPDKNFKLMYVGEGRERNHLKALLDSQHLNEQVSLKGQIPRDKIKQLYDKADCMIMISKGEAFGLVYLEAMSRGCITIGSKKEGIDGIIIDGYNGFLCEAGNDVALATVIKHIKSLSQGQLKAISDNAVATTKKLTDYQVAYDYIKAIE